MMHLRIAAPNKGRLATPAIELLKAIGLPLEESVLTDRKLLAKVGKGQTVLLARAADIPQYVAGGAADVGITGVDLLEESAAAVERLQPLGFGRCRLDVAVPQDSPITTLTQIPPGSVVATSFPAVVERHFAAAGLPVTVRTVSGATEVTTHIGVADLIVDLTASGTTLQQNQLREIGTILQSEAVLVGNPTFVAAHASEVAELTATIRSVLDARLRRYLMANVPRARLEAVREVLPGLDGPTVMDLMGRPDWVAIHAVAGEREVNGIVAALRSLGATGILVMPIERMVP